MWAHGLLSVTMGMFIVKGIEKMSKKKAKKENTPVFPFIAGSVAAPFAFGAFAGGTNKGKSNKDAKGFVNDLKTIWEKSIDLQKSFNDSAKGQYIKFVDYMMDVQDTFFENLPDEAPSISGLPELGITPKSFSASFKDFEKMANDYFIEQADSFLAFAIESQEKTIELLPDLFADKDDEVIEVEAEVENAE